jgi:hypothetical protein
MSTVASNSAKVSKTGGKRTVVSEDLPLTLLTAVTSTLVMNALGLGREFALVAVALSPLVADLIKNAVAARGWSKRRLVLLTAVLVFLGSVRNALAAVARRLHLVDAHRRPRPERGAVPFSSVIATSALATALTIGLFTGAELARGKALFADRETTFFSTGPRADIRDPRNVRSVTIQPRNLTSRSRIVIVWTRNPDAVAYSIRWSHTPAEPDHTVELPGHATRTTFDASPGTWWFNLSTEGEGARWTNTIHLGPFLVAPPDSGRVRGPQLDRTTLSFAALTVGRTSPPETLFLHAGARKLSVLRVVADHPEEFLVREHCPARLAARASCTIDVRFRPTASGRRSTVLRVAVGRGTRLTALLVGRGIAPLVATLAPRDLRFGEVNVHGQSPARRLTLTAGLKDLTILGIASDSTEFEASSHCPTTLTKSKSCSIDVAFTPTSAGSKSAALLIDVASGQPLRTALTGVGVSPPTIRPPSMKFGEVVVGGRRVETALLTAGSKPLTMIGLETSDREEFLASSECATHLAPAKSCGIAITFRPLATGLRKGLLTVSFSDRSQLTLPLAGVGIEAFIRLEPTSLDLGPVAIDMPDSSRKEVKLTNAGSAPLTITNIISSDRQFSVKSGCPATLSAGSNCTFSVTFRPSTLGRHSAIVTVMPNGSGQHTLPVSGLGVIG